MNIAVFASHGGSDLQAVIDACKSGDIKASVCVVISNNGDARALQRAADEGIDNYHLNSRVAGTQEMLEQRVLKILNEHQIDMIFLAGYLKKLGTTIVKAYEGRIFNIHPALLPKFGGTGMYGLNVHSAVIEAGEKTTGITIHRVDDEYDNGEIIAQTVVEVMRNDTPESLSERVLEREHTFLVDVIKEVVSGKVRLGKKLE